MRKKYYSNRTPGLRQIRNYKKDVKYILSLLDVMEVMASLPPDEFEQFARALWILDGTSISVLSENFGSAVIDQIIGDFYSFAPPRSLNCRFEVREYYAGQVKFLRSLNLHEHALDFDAFERLFLSHHNLTRT